MKTYAGILLIVGSVLFSVGLLIKPVIDVFGNTDDKAAQQAYIEDNPTGWDIGSGAVGAGALTAAVGFALFAMYLQSGTDNQTFKWMLSASGVLVVVGALGWVGVSYLRISRTPEEVVNDMNGGPILFPAFVVLTETAFALLGIVMFRSKYIRWLGVLLAVVGVLLFIQFVITGDIIPGTFYPVLIIAGIAILMKKSPATQSA